MDPDQIPYMETENYLEAFPVAETEAQPLRRLSTVAVVSSGVAAAAALGGLVLTALERKSAPSPVLNGHLLFSALSLGFALFCVLWAFLSRKKVLRDETPPAFLSLLAFLGSLSLGAYNLLAAFALWLGRCSRVAVTVSPALSAKAAQQGPESGGALQFGACLLALLCAVCLGLVACAAFSFLTNKLQTSKIALLLALPCAGLLAGAGLVLALTHEQLATALSAHLTSVPQLVWVFAALLAAVLLLAVLNALLSLFRSETGHFLLGFLWLFLGLGLLFAGGLVLRDVRRGTCGRGVSCRAAAEVIHADDYARFCPQGKYLASGHSCRRADLVTRWEKGNAPAFLNSRCCAAAGGIALWPFFLLALATLGAAAAAGLAAAANFAHVEVDESQSDYFNHFNVVDLLTLLAVVVVVAAMTGVALRARKTQTSKTRSPPDSLVATPAKAALAPMCYSLDAASLPLLSLGGCGNFARCGVAAGLLVLNGRFERGSSLGEVEEGAKTLREGFFEENKGEAGSDFLALRGSPEALNKALPALRVCQTSLGEPHFVALRTLPTDLNSPFAHPTPLPRASLSSFAQRKTCAGACEALLLSAGRDEVLLHGRLLVKNARGELVAYGVPEAGLELLFGAEQRGSFASLAEGSYDAAGRFRVSAPLPAQGGYVGTLRITDSKRHYLAQAVDVAVTRPSGAVRALDLGDIVLVTPSGKGCKGAQLKETLACFSKQRATLYALRLRVAEALGGGAPRTPVRFSLRRTYSRGGTLVRGPAAVVGGKIALRLPAGYYTLFLEGRDHAPLAEPVLLDQDRSGTVTLFPAGGPSRLFLESAPGEFDYELGARTPDGRGGECTVSSLSPHCPLARKRVESGPEGREFQVIELAGAAETASLAYVAKSPALPGCATTARSARPYSLFASGWGRDAYPSSLGNAGLAGLAAAGGGLPARSGPVAGFAFLPQLWREAGAAGEPIQVGSLVLFPALFAAVKAASRGDAKALAVPDRREYFDFMAGEPGSARLFLRSMPVLYGNEGGELEAFVGGLAAATALSPGMRGAAKEGLEGLRADGFEARPKSLAALTTALLLARQQRGRDEPVRPSTTGVPFRGFPASTEKAVAAPSAQPPLGGLSGRGEEPYSIVNGRSRVIDDVEVGADCGQMRPLRPLTKPTTPTAPSGKALVGVELCGQIAVHGEDARQPVCAQPSAKQVDQRGLDPAARQTLPPATHSTVYFSQLLPSPTSRVSRYLKEDLGTMCMTLAGGSVLQSTLFNEVQRKELLRSEKGPEGLYRAYNDGSSSIVYRNGTELDVGPRAAFFRWRVPVTRNTTVVTTRWVEEAGEAASRHALGFSDLVAEAAAEIEEPSHLAATGEAAPAPSTQSPAATSSAQSPAATSSAQSPAATPSAQSPAATPVVFFCTGGARPGPLPPAADGQPPSLAVCGTAPATPPA